MSKKIAVVLCGSGYLDGSEIRESVSVLLALSQQGAAYQCFAPDDFQTDVVNSLTQEASSEKRNMLIESARIARSDVKPLSELQANDFDGIIIPGGFGVAKSLCSFAFKGSMADVRSDIKKVLESFHGAKKPIGAVCIAPALVALSFKHAGFTLTLGAHSEASDELEKLGHKHEVCEANAIVVDKMNKVVSTPAYMYDHASLKDIFCGIESLVKQVLSF